MSRLKIYHKQNMWCGWQFSVYYQGDYDIIYPQEKLKIEKELGEKEEELLLVWNWSLK